MTHAIGNDPALPAPVDPANPPVDPQASPGLTITAIEDVDDIEVREAMAAVQAEESAAAPTGDQTVAGAAPAAPGAPAAPADPALPAPRMVPLPRFNEVLTRANTAEQNAAYWRGQAEARMPQAPAAGGAVEQQQPAQTVEQRLAAIDVEADALASKFDAGEITYTALKAEERKLNAQAEAIRKEEKPAAPAATQQPSARDDLYLETLTQQLETEHPWTQVFNQLGKAVDAEWGLVATRARENLAERGVDLNALPPAVRALNIRQECAKVATELGPTLLAAKAKAAGIPVPGQTTTTAAPPAQPQPPVTRTLTPEQQARANKLAMRAGAPLDFANMGGGSAPPDGGFTEAQLEGMTDEDLAALPAAVQAKFLGTA